MKKNWKLMFKKLIKNYPNNIEITYGKVVDGSTKPIELFIQELLNEQRAEIIEEIKNSKELKELPNYWDIVGVLDSLTTLDQLNKGER